MNIQLKNRIFSKSVGDVAGTLPIRPFKGMLRRIQWVTLIQHKNFITAQFQSKIKALAFRSIKPSTFHPRVTTVRNDDPNSEILTYAVTVSHLQTGSPLPPSAESPVVLATQSQSPTTQDTIRLIVRGSLGSCSSSSECKLTSLVLVGHTRPSVDVQSYPFSFNHTQEVRFNSRSTQVNSCAVT